jgi:pimeloyl-ACP methyl ester carboxylesterase
VPRPRFRGGGEAAIAASSHPFRRARDDDRSPQDNDGTRPHLRYLDSRLGNVSLGADAAWVLRVATFLDEPDPGAGRGGVFAVAPNQRGYAAEARPDPAIFDNYGIEKLIGDALDIIAPVGHGGSRFHLVGHDWGGSLSWIIADRYPERLASLTMQSRPHPTSFARAMKYDPEQPHRSRHHRELLDPDAGPRLLANNVAWVRDRLTRNGLPADAIERHLSVLGNPPAMEAALAWYRARGERPAVGPTKVPTLFIWGDADDTVGRMAAEGTAACGREIPPPLPSPGS